MLSDSQSSEKVNLLRIEPGSNVFHIDIEAIAVETNLIRRPATIDIAVGIGERR